jgi:proline iminopeptidase
MRTSRRLRWIAFVVLLAAAGIGVWAASKGRTPPFRDDRGRVVPGSIATLERVSIGGVGQAILIRGRDVRNPVLLFLHGGPGMPAMYLAHCCEGDLESDFVVVNWDQRGAGKSFGQEVRPETMNVEQFVSDTAEVIEYLRRRLHVGRVYLVGHSWGSYLGTLVALRYPERLLAYVGVGQVADEERGKLLADDFIRARARETGEQKAFRDLAERGGAVREDWLFRFGGVLHRSRSWWPLLWAGFGSPEYTLTDVRNVPRGPQFAAKYMRYNVISGPLMESVTSLSVPVYFFLGRYDYDAPSALAVEYFEKLQAPRKRLVWFEESAHYPFFEEPNAFARAMRRVAAETVPH